jgi:hypothetical protein
MRLMLHYRGTLKANGSPGHKHDIRKAFHRQLRTLWQQKPLAEMPDLREPRKRPGEYSLLRPLESFIFVPLVASETNSIAEVVVNLLRPEAPGGLLTQGGDIDNRLKTLFDALTVPRHTNALPPDAGPGADETPFYCLLEDDNLITSLQVRTDQLLEPVHDPGLVDLTIYVRTRVTRPTIGNSFLA